MAPPRPDGCLLCARRARIVWPPVAQTHRRRLPTCRWSTPTRCSSRTTRRCDVDLSITRRPRRTSRFDRPRAPGVTSIDWTRAVDVALCFGWIDGISRGSTTSWYRGVNPHPAREERLVEDQPRAHRTTHRRGADAGLAWLRWKGRRRTADGPPPATARPPQSCPTTSPPPWPRATSPRSTRAGQRTASPFAIASEPQCDRRPAPAASNSPPTPSPRARTPYRRRRRGPVPASAFSAHNAARAASLRQFSALIAGSWKTGTSGFSPLRTRLTKRGTTRPSNDQHRRGWIPAPKRVGKGLAPQTAHDRHSDRAGLV